MVVMAVLAILSSLFFPSLKRALRVSFDVTCVQNQKAMGQSFSLYVEDHERYPVFRRAKSTSTDPKHNHSVFWDDLLGAGYDGRDLSVEQQDKWSLLGNETAGAEMYSCPLDDGDLRTFAFPSKYKGVIANQVSGRVRSYGMNSYRTWQGLTEEQKEGITGLAYNSVDSAGGFETWSVARNRIKIPSKVFLLVERPGAGYVGGGGGATSGNPLAQDGYYDWKNWNDLGVNMPEYSNIRFHNSGWNYLMADGHAENLLPEATIAEGGDLSNPMGGFWTINPND